MLQKFSFDTIKNHSSREALSFCKKKHKEKCGTVTESSQKIRLVIAI